MTLENPPICVYENITKMLVDKRGVLRLYRQSPRGHRIRWELIHPAGEWEAAVLAKDGMCRVHLKRDPSL